MMHDPILRIKRAQGRAGDGPGAPEERFPVVGFWYHGEDARGTGALACYDGYGAFRMGDGTEVDMTKYDYLVEHQPPGGASAR